MHNFKEITKNCILQVFSDTIQKCILSKITQLKDALLKGLLYIKKHLSFVYFRPKPQKSKDLCLVKKDVSVFEGEPKWLVLAFKTKKVLRAHFGERVGNLCLQKIKYLH